MRKNVPFKVFSAILFLLFTTQSWSQINITAGGTAVTENFNSLGSSTTAALPTNWKVSKSAAVRDITAFASAGSAVELAAGNSMSSSASNGIYRFNANGSTSESSIGGLASGSASKTVTVYVNLKNNAATPISSFTISYDVEKFRNGTNGTFTIELFYSTDGTNFTACGSDFVNGFAADANNTGYTTAPGATASVTNKTFTPASNVPQNQNIYFAWRYSVSGTNTTTSNAQALGIDNVSIKANAPSSSATDYFRSQASGNWSDVATWESSSDNTNWIDATLAPTSSAASVSILTSHTVTVAADITVSDVNINSGGKLVIAPTVAITVPTGKAVDGLGYLILSSSAAGTARVANSAGNISASTVAERYIPGGRRAFRFLSHPFSAAIELSQLTDSIDITGAGGITNGFTTTVSNSPSAFWYDPTLPNAGTNDPNGSDYGWVAFTKTDGVGANAWNAKQGIRLLLRGAKGEGLNGIAYTPSETHLSMLGVLNGGNQTLTVPAAGFNLLGNPYPSPVNVGPAINAAGNLGAAYYVWDANAATKGAYVTQVINGSTYNLDANAVIVVQATAATAINLTEADKAAAPTSAVFRTPGSVKSGILELQLLQAGNYWDNLYVRFNDKASTAKDAFDAIKMGNADLNFYTLSSDNQHLALDSRKAGEATTIIPLGIATGYQKDFTIKVADLGLADMEVYLRDKLLNKDIKMEAGTEYTFTISSDAATQGNNRFELTLQKKLIAQPVLMPAVFSVKLSPNPAKDHVLVNFDNEEKANTTIIFVNSLGQTVKTVNAGKVQSGQLNIDVKGLAKGNYFITLNNGKVASTQQLQIQ